VLAFILEAFFIAAPTDVKRVQEEGAKRRKIVPTRSEATQQSCISTNVQIVDMSIAGPRSRSDAWPG